MIINIDAEQVAAHLALQDVYSYFHAMGREELTRKAIKEFINNGTKLPIPSSSKYKPADNAILHMYHKQHDYYFETLTNLHL